MFVSRTHILQSGLTLLGTQTDFVTRFLRGRDTFGGKQERSYFHTVITAYMYKNIFVCEYANVLMC